MEEELQENDIVLCTVKRIEGTTVFLEVTFNSKIIQGSMIFSEVSPGRIRNIREYVVPNKKIVCKVLRIKDGHPQLSLRRVTTKEKEEVLDRAKKEKVLINLLKPIFSDKIDDILVKIGKDYELSDFLDEAREDPSILKNYIPKDKIENLTKIITEKKDKEKEVKTIITLTSDSKSGIDDIKEILDINENGSNIFYLGSSKFAINVKAKTYKDANAILDSLVSKIKDNAKKKNAKLSIKEQK